MTFEEAKKILEKEGYCLIKVSKGFEFSELPVMKKQEVIEATRVVNENSFAVSMTEAERIDRQERLKKEYEKNTKTLGPGEEQAKKGNPALKESASQFNDALLDEQGKKIKHLTKKIARLNKIIHKKNIKIEEFRKESSRHLRGKIKMFGENLDLSQELCDKNEELRLTKIREKNLAELGLKYVGENEKLKKKLADKIVDEIDARALKSAESALAWKEKVIAEKDDVIADLGKELAATKKELEEKAKLVEEVRKYSKEYREYGIEAVKMIQKMAKAIVGEKPICSEDFKEYRRLANGYMVYHQLPEFSEEELMKIQKKVVASCDIAEEGGDHSGKIVLCGKDFGKLLKENEESAEELSKVLNDVIDQFLLFGEIIIKSEK